MRLRRFENSDFKDDLVYCICDDRIAGTFYVAAATRETDNGYTILVWNFDDKALISYSITAENDDDIIGELILEAEEQGWNPEELYDLTES